jgi:hypothetical protein
MAGGREPYTAMLPMVAQDSFFTATDTAVLANFGLRAVETSEATYGMGTDTLFAYIAAGGRWRAPQ